MSIADAQKIGVRRVSAGGSLHQAVMAAFERIVQQLLTTGDLNVSPPPIPGAELDRLFQTNHS